MKPLCKAVIPDLYDAALGSIPDHPTKPDPWGIELFLKEGGFEPEDCLFVGDSNVDVQTAMAGNLACTGVTWGFRSRQELMEAGASWVADTAEELKATIHGEENRD